MTSAKSADRISKRARAILRRLRAEYGDAQSGLSKRPPFQFLVSVILSAQCTDIAVNRVTPRLSKAYPTPKKMARARLGSIEALIRSLGLYRAKAKNLRGTARALVERHGGRVPRTMPQLLELPGVGRKTANVVLPNLFGTPGLAVDTHVIRLSGLLGLSAEKDPGRIEKQLCALLPPESWGFISHALIWHGRGVCIARRPRCRECTLKELCPSAALGG